MHFRIETRRQHAPKSYRGRFRASGTDGMFPVTDGILCILPQYRAPSSMAVFFLIRGLHTIRRRRARKCRCSGRRVLPALRLTSPTRQIKIFLTCFTVGDDGRGGFSKRNFRCVPLRQWLGFGRIPNIAASSARNPESPRFEQSDSDRDRHSNRLCL